VTPASATPPPAGLTPSTFNLSNGGTQSYGPPTQVQPGNYSVTEATIPAGWTLKSLVCTATGTGTSFSTSGATVSITMAPNGLVDFTYTNHINLHPSIATTLSANPVEVGSTVHDSVTLSGASANAGGTVTYTVYTDGACSLNAQAAGTVTVTNGVVPDSNPITFNQAGDFFWQAVYSGDANNNSATSACTSEHLVVTPKHPAMSTAPNLLPNDDATLSGATPTATLSACGVESFTLANTRLTTHNLVGLVLRDRPHHGAVDNSRNRPIPSR